MSEKSNISISAILKGAAMGIAEVIPGVSGGTIAFITGIYERLINAIKSVDGQALKLLFSFKLKQFFRHIDGTFLLVLGLGMFLGIAVGVLGVGYLLEEYPAPVWAFFFGLIIASAIYIGKQITKWNVGPILGIMLGCAIALGITYISPAEGSTNLLWVFACGAIAISALILPGVSGSFILLLLGMYTVVRGAAESVMLDQDSASIFIILAFMMGCVIGLVSFSRVLSYAFKHYKNLTLSILTGFMIGSLRKIWPWRNVDSYLDKSTMEIVSYDNTNPLPDDIQVLKEMNVMPSDFIGDPQTLLVIVSGVVGFILIFILDRFDTK